MENPLPCGCAIMGYPELVSNDHYETLTQVYRDQFIKFCPLHAAAPDMLAMLNEIPSHFYYDNKAGGYQIGVVSTEKLIAKIYAAIAAAEPGEVK